ncbi:hypothetical protein QMK17_26055 [Rhodococcus sp. G-MC3]|nr:hypothetical protein [Rhodococcus sp. G-MC3]MDJ0396756.1 hypothetical protein [Rhodococcus sp. G-MC3]
MPQNTIRQDRKATAAHNARAAGIITHTTAIITGPQNATITVTAATDEA